MVLQQIEQSFGGNPAHKLGRRTDRGQWRVQELGKPEVVKSHHSHIFRDAISMSLERPQDTDRSVVVA
jgi:hypothetical protein